MNYGIYAQLGISRKVTALGEEVLKDLKERFCEIDETAEYNQAKVLLAMQKNRVDAACLTGTTGYGHDDRGRDTLEQVYADVFHTEAALVRPALTCGTHALATALSANLLPGDELLSPVGKPYDTLEEVIGIRESPCSLKELGVSYRQVDLKADGAFDYEGIKNAINDRTKLVTIQRSKGYQMRPTFSVAQIGELIAFVKSVKPGLNVMVDNCYGEFTEETEPSRPRRGAGRGREHGREPQPVSGLLPLPHRGGLRAEGRDLRREPLRAAWLFLRAERAGTPARYHSEHRAGQQRGDGGLLRRHSGRRACGQLRHPRALPDPRVRRRGHHGGGRVHTGLIHRAFGRRTDPPALRGLFSGGTYLAARKTGDPVLAAETI